MATDPQKKFFDDQDILSLDIDGAYRNFIIEIDNIRSHFNALTPSSDDINTPDFQESRCHAFYRMLGLPVVNDATASSFYSPGYDPNKNVDDSATEAHDKILKDFIAPGNTVALLSKFREQEVDQIYKPIFATQNINATALALASIFIRPLRLSNNENTESLSAATGGIDPFESNSGNFTTEAKLKIKTEFFADKTDPPITVALGKSHHPLKPFIVDPRIESSIRPQKNNICAPFLLDKTQTKIFAGPGGISLKRPYIERVITVRLNTVNVTLPANTVENAFVQTIIDTIKSDSKITDEDLVDLVQNPQNLHKSELLIFSKYVRLIRAVINLLHNSIVRMGQIRNDINYQPIPNKKIGPEGGCKLNPIDDSDSRNLKIENDLAKLKFQKILDEASFDSGQSDVSYGDFAFSNIDDTVFDSVKNISKSYDGWISSLDKLRNKTGDEASDVLKTIEIIMGEFSGLGLLDVLIIQAALWIMKSDSLVGLIDSRAFDRMKLRKGLNSPSSQPNVTDSLKELEFKVIEVYRIAEKYYNDLIGGDLKTSK